jgi:hypothetical protein
MVDPVYKNSLSPPKLELIISLTSANTTKTPSCSATTALNLSFSAYLAASRESPIAYLAASSSLLLASSAYLESKVF